ncbi:predicted protein, partial [Nematostella vectensis]
MAGDFYQILTGDITNLPSKESNIVRIFTSSTFTDTFEERNLLMRDVYPSLRKYCQQHSLEFQVVDMRWGVRDEATADHKTSDLCIQEIKNCQRLTQGPNYVCFLGNKYGYRPVPYKINAEEFESLVDIAREVENVKKEEVDLLLEWFLKNENALPAEYVLQPVTAKLPYYNDMREEVHDKYSQQREEWWKISVTFQRVLRISAHVAGRRGKLTEEQVHKYYKSVTEHEIEHGILNCADPEAQTLCYIREIEDINLNIKDEKIPLYTDIADGGHDAEAQEHLFRLKRQRVLDKLKAENVVQYSVPWNSRGINASDRRHHEYLENFCNRFESDLTRLIDRSLECSAFRGRQEILSRARDYLCRYDSARPLVVYGASGSGKTSIMAVIAFRVKEWLGDNAVCIFRFLGTSPGTSNTLLTIKSVCEQIHQVFGLESLKEDVAEDYTELVRHFHELLSTLSVSAERPLVLVLDSVDQLSPSYNAHLMNWLPKSLSDHIKIVISVLPGYYEILPTLQRSLTDTNCYIEVPTLSRDTGHEILDAWLDSKHRTLTPEQRVLVMAAFDKCPQPLFLKLIFAEASEWASYTDVSGVSLGANVPEAIGFLFERLERKHGKMLFSRALQYVTAARSGLTENELEDILSLDDDVIDDVYQYWDPPVEGVVRLPNLLWARVRSDIDEFLVERQADGKTVVAWYHRQFWEACERMYLKDGVKVDAHALMAEFFLGEFWTWGGGRKKHIVLTRRQKALPDADRQVSAQPLMFSKEIFNLRKLSELPYHLVHSKQFNALSQEVLFNFEWIMAKVKAQSLNSVLADYDTALQAKPDLDIRLVQDTLILSSSNIKHDLNSLAPQLIGRLLAFKGKFPRIASLLEQAYRWIYARNIPVIAPMNACLISPGGPLITNLHGHTQRLDCVTVTRDDKFIVTSGGDSLINIWNTENHDCIHTLKIGGKGQSHLVLTNDDRFVVAAADSSFGAWDIDTGEKVVSFESHVKITCLAVTLKGDCVVTGCADHITISIASCNPFSFVMFFVVSGAINAILVTAKDWVISGSDDSTVRAWDLENGESCAVFQGHSKPVLCLQIINDGQAIVSGSEDKVLRVWDLVSRDCVSLKGHGGLIKCLAAMHDGKRIVSGAKDNNIKVWDLVRLECQATLKGHTSLIWAIAVSRDDSVIVSASKDDLLKVWRTESWVCTQTLIGHSSWISCVAMTTDGKTIISGSNDKNVKMWYTHGNAHAQAIGVPSDHIMHHLDQPRCVMVDFGRKGVSGANEDNLKIWDMRTQECIITKPASVSCVTRVATSPKVVTGSSDGEMKLWDCVTGECVTIARHDGAVTCAQVTQDGTQVVSGSADGTDSTIRLWDLTKGECKQVMQGHTNEVLCLSVTSNDKTIVSGSNDFTARVWNVATGKCVSTVKFQDSVMCVTITNDDCCFIVGSHTNHQQLRMFDISSGKLVKDLNAHTHAVMRIELLRAHNMLVSSSRDGTVKVWDVANAHVIDSFDFQSQVRNFDVMPHEDGYVLLVMTKSGTVAILKLLVPKKEERQSVVSGLAKEEESTPTEDE